MRPVVLILLLWSLPLFLWSQFHQPVLTGLEGQALIDALEDQYRPAFTLSNSDAKDTLYARIYAVNDSVSCVYTGHRAYLTPGADPSQTVFDSDINLEHTYPKSKGTGNSLAENDMHHLFPSREDVNNDRGSHPLLEIADNQTERWYYLNQTTTNIPGSQIDRYSEGILNASFEPREDHKGNAARAIFYVYTVYNGEVTAVDPDFFEIQRTTLCQWHFQDPVDSLEWVRNQWIAGYQNDKPNPFILDCTLAARTYCGEVSGECLNVNALPAISNPALHLSLFPNPGRERLQLEWSLPGQAAVQFSLTDAQGRTIRRWSVPQGRTTDEIDLKGLPAGLYLVQLASDDYQIYRQLVIAQ